MGLGNILPLTSDAADSDVATGSTPAVRARALFTPPALAMSLSPRGRSASSRALDIPAPVPCPRQAASRLRHDAPEFVPPLLKAPASCPDAPEIAPSATRSAPSEADLLPALDSGREKLLSSTESEDALKESKLARTLAIILYLRLSSYRCSSRCYHPRPTPSLPFQVLGEPKTTVHTVNDIVSADPKGQVSRLEPTPSKYCPLPRDQCWLASHSARLTSLGDGEDARRAD